MTRATKSRAVGGALVAAAALIGFVGGALGDGGEAVRSAVEATATATAAAALAGQVPYLAAGGALIGLGVGVGVASGATYWYQSKQIGGRLE
ncbi:hypothetical protein [Halorubrum amylolyticum]|uniref:hypothetical protein n=1 Tax=Halorubrum amylolyticum TaxID=2508724 RepID=UPI00100912BD|nr:hypothetical protein [Halorubrum amylolyticum]